MTDAAGGRLPWCWLGRTGYDDGRAIQERRRDRVIAGEAPECLILLEHDPVITLGRTASREHVLLPEAELERRGIALAPTTRGGDVTYHGPGQLMVYPVLRLRRGLVTLLADLAGALADAAAELGVPGASWRRDPAGLWIGDAKLAACGLHVRRRVCSHGFAFNVSTPPEAWRAIVPCGLSGARPTSIDAERRARGLGPAPAVAGVASIVAEAVARRLGKTAGWEVLSEAGGRYHEPPSVTR